MARRIQTYVILFVASAAVVFGVAAGQTYSAATGSSPGDVPSAPVPSPGPPPFDPFEEK